jgi:hypothetical protein
LWLKYESEARLGEERELAEHKGVATSPALGVSTGESTGRALDALD